MPAPLFVDNAARQRLIMPRACAARRTGRATHTDAATPALLCRPPALCRSCAWLRPRNNAALLVWRGGALLFDSAASREPDAAYGSSAGRVAVNPGRQAERAQRGSRQVHVQQRHASSLRVIFTPPSASRAPGAPDMRIRGMLPCLRQVALNKRACSPPAAMPCFPYRLPPGKRVQAKETSATISRRSVDAA